MAVVSSKAKFEWTPEIARPIATIPFEAAAVITGSDTWLLDKDEEDRHAVRLAAAGNELGIQIPYVAVGAYVSLVAITVLDRLRSWRKERFAAAGSAAAAKEKDNANPST